MMTTTRITAIFVLFVAIVVLPYWLYLPLLFAAALVFPFFWEGILFALFIDAVYGHGVGIFPPSVSLLSLSILALLIALLPLRERIRSHA